MVIYFDLKVFIEEPLEDQTIDHIWVVRSSNSQCSNMQRSTPEYLQMQVTLRVHIWFVNSKVLQLLCIRDALGCIRTVPNRGRITSSSIPMYAPTSGFRSTPVPSPIARGDDKTKTLYTL